MPARFGDSKQHVISRGLPVAASDGAADSLPTVACRASGGRETPRNMTVQFQIRGMRDDQAVRRQMITDLGELCGLIEVTGAHVALHLQREVTPAWQVVAMLTVPGPVIHVAARDYTWHAAWEKVLFRVREQVEERVRRQTVRPQAQPQVHGALTNRGRR